MIDPAFTSGLALALEKAINSALIYDPGSRAELGKLRGSVFHFACSAPELDLFFAVEPDGEKVSVSTYSEQELSTKISASCTDALGFLLRSSLSNSTNLADSGVKVMGSSAKLLVLRRIIQNLEIDWEQALQDYTRPLGEYTSAATHQFANVVKTLLGWKNNVRGRFKKNLAAYLQEELRLVPGQQELDDFYNNLAELRSGVDRAEARMQVLIQKINKQ